MYIYNIYFLYVHIEKKNFLCKLSKKIMDHGVTVACLYCFILWRWWQWYVYVCVWRSYRGGIFLEPEKKTWSVAFRFQALHWRVHLPRDRPRVPVSYQQQAGKVLGPSISGIGRGVIAAFIKYVCLLSLQQPYSLEINRHSLTLWLASLFG